VLQQFEKNETATTAPEPITEVPDKITDIPDEVTDIPVKTTDIPKPITETPEKQKKDNENPKYEKVDIDLTELSSTLIYSEVYNMMMTPEDYIGKTIRMDGDFYTFYDEGLKQYFFACVIQDATACCAQGIEFVLAGEYTYPDDYPEEGSYIKVAGVFDTYEDEEYIYCTLRNAVLEQ
nr:hypothetical protein [Lachnospiraceae bacterium]